ncbi:MAG: lipid-A-disaccharide synthase [Gammaproteobacteria bacterium]|nr:lipid-A-disaccharide synthase [Gammaproteobacteria bacterium]MCW9004770.1 lipid-A-disaccharide synthase [Gammaproteobacteria bacterium]MCW9055037.1 lipid-A-disaccharide synthase [Gammaproteobacteria bacterium]
MISAGEASGDLHAANLIKALRSITPDIKVNGMGGDKLRDAGARLQVDCAEMAVVGIVEVLANLPRILRNLNKLRDELKTNPPDLLILVDYQEFNFKLAKTAKQCGVKVLFYISPQVWAWRPHRVHKIGKLIDMMAVLFPFEEKFYKKAHVPVRFVGNPLVDEARPDASREQTLQQHGLKTEQKVLGLFPGSRRNEIKRILPIQLKAAEILKQKHPELQFILPIASTINEDEINIYLQHHQALDVHAVRDNVYNIMQACDTIITASGTATLEIALMGIPNVITYEISPISYFILKRLVTIENIGLVNIVAEKSIVKEFIQYEATPENIANEIDRILTDVHYRNNMIAELDQVRAKLGKEGGSNNVAQLAYEMLE